MSKPVHISHVKRHGNFLAKRDGGFKCHYCGIALIRCRADQVPLIRSRGFGRATVDHKVPLSKGGGYEVANMLLACEDCNKRKGDCDYNLFVKMLELERDEQNKQS